MTMRTIRMCVHCPDKNSELLVDDEKQNELIIEDIVGIALLQVFDMVLVDDVTVHYSPEDDDGDGDGDGD